MLHGRIMIVGDVCSFGIEHNMVGAGKVTKAAFPEIVCVLREMMDSSLMSQGQLKANDKILFVYNKYINLNLKFMMSSKRGSHHNDMRDCDNPSFFLVVIGEI